MAPLGEGRDDPVLPDLPRGPLHAARARASFPWKELALFWEGSDMLRFKVRLGWAAPGDPRGRAGSAGWLGPRQKGGAGPRGIIGSRECMNTEAWGPPLSPGKDSRLCPCISGLHCTSEAMRRGHEKST